MFPLTILANLLYPPACLLCHTLLPVPGSVPDSSRSEVSGTAVLCAECARDRPRAPVPAGQAAAGEAARAPWRYTHRAAQAVQQFKYHRRWRIGRWLAEEMADTARTWLPLHDIDAIVPVPQHWLKCWLRGFDPVAQLAHDVSRSLRRPCLPRALRRTRWTVSQTTLQTRARRRNVRNAFAAAPKAVQGRAILLVDDVLTSGATAHACAEALRQAGASRVFVLTAARTFSNE